MFAHSRRFAALTAAAWFALPFGLASAQEDEAAPATEQKTEDAEPATGGSGDTSSESSAGKSQCNYGDPNLEYVSKDPNQCAAVTFICEDGYEGFFNECGCGCQPIM